MLLIRDKDNALTDSNSETQYELHLQHPEAVNIIGPAGDELWVYIENGKLVCKK